MGVVVRLMVWRGVAGRELLLLLGVLVAVFAYLEVPVWNSVLFGVAVVFQAALGTVVLSRLLAGVSTSLMLLLGPGLILGGALSFAVFQLVGRGWFGLLVVTLLGGLSVIRLSGASSWQPSTQRLWIMGQVLGLGALALTWEFGELLPVAVAFFALGFLTSNSPQLPRVVQWVAFLAAAALITTPLVLRQDYWWLVTDDYRFFEVLATHITNSGPFADWGAMNWSRYHWLSYGWSGLLNELGGQPEPFTTLTRIMPITYSASLAASLIHLTKHLTTTTLTPLTLTPAWAILALNPLDWSGTSTAGIYPAITALTALAIHALTTRQSLVRRATLYTCFLPIITLTKLPGVFATAFALVLLEVATYLKGKSKKLTPILLTITYITATSITFAGIWLGSKILGGYEIVAVNPALGDLATFGRNFAVLFLALQDFPILLVSAIVLVLLICEKGGLEISHTQLFILTPIAIVGFALASVIYSNAENYTYFSQPFVFLASFGLLTTSTLVGLSTHEHRLSRHILSLVLLLAIGNVWVMYDGAIKFWRSIGAGILEWDPNRVAVLQYVTADSRLAVSIVVFAFSLLWVMTGQRSFRPQATSLLISVVLMSTLNSLIAIEKVLRNQRSSTEIEQSIGSIEVRDAGRWLLTFVPPADGIATNHLFDVGQGTRFSSDFALGAWSRREFLLLGPKFADSLQAMQSELDLVLSYAANPSSEHAMQLKAQGVKWFVVDKFSTTFSDWRDTTEVAFENEQFLIVRL